jgi:aldehyde oxidoreductase
VWLTADVGNTATTLDAGKTSASRQTFVSGNAARLAALDLRAKLLRLANAGDGAAMRFESDALIIGPDQRRIALEELPADLDGFGTYDPPTTPLDENGQGIPYATYGFAAQIAEVLVDTALGTTKVLHIHAAHDVGRAINPTLVEGQIQGGIAQGLGLALMEEFIPGRTENLHDYLIPTVGDIPPISIYIIEDPDPEGPYGAKGVGEPALVATAPAILGAIRHATGVGVRKVPVLPHRLWEALRALETRS